MKDSNATAVRIMRRRAVEIPSIADIRSGGMRLVKLKDDATEAQKKAHANDMKIFAAGEKAGESWDDIAKKLSGKLTPCNRDFFTVRPIDCGENPGNAEILQKLYADPDGKIRTLPIILTMPDVKSNIPYTLECWGASEIRYWCDIDDDGRDVCVAPIAREKGKRAYGERNVRVVRRCDPVECQEYQDHKCTYSGYIQGIVPGPVGIGLCRIHTGSWYSFGQMEAKLESIRRLIGRIHNLVKAGTQDPILFVRKVSDKEIARFIADTGKTVRTGQDLIYIDAKVQMIELMTQYSPEKRIECGRAAMALLSGERPEVQDAAEPETETVRTATEQFTVVEKEERPEPSERDRLFSQVIVLQDRLKTYGDATFQAFRETHKIYRSEDKTSNADLTAYIEAITAEVANLELPPAEPRTSEIADVAWEDEVGLDDVPGRIPEEDDIPL